MTDMPQIYLVTPPEIDSGFADRLASVLDVHDVACLRLHLATHDEDRITRAADATREVAHRFDVPIVISDHPALVEKLGLDGVHLTDPRPLRKLRADWGPEPIIGAFCGTSRHDGMTAGDAGADYVAFGPAGPTSGEQAEAELFQWWSQMIELPCVAEGALDLATIESLKAATDFIALGEEIWSHDEPAIALAALTAPFRT
ncbi:thiamine phosphate synthase [Jannaschia donghaensis]|uniref:Thiamine-phosphate pyrophosphorylase n=1 Tax=Jannaschia donghaensis TaxID=420998 RepID=A0A0M6YMI8_9RHOB|nr:thiamine phosphate synthase [Jannaschia donghaensis]CTQ50477.1 thiamine-phosphate pyrophosphorylase [Jannaschia donghaensis]